MKKCFILHATATSALAFLAVSCQTTPSVPSETDNVAGKPSLGFPASARARPKGDEILQVSQRSVDLMINYEVGGEAHFRTNLRYVTYPGGASGPTFGIGYDAGYKSANQIEADWKPYVSARDLRLLKSVAGIKGPAAREAAQRLKEQGVTIAWQDAMKVFLNRTLPRFAEKLRSTYPGSEELEPDAAGSLLSLIFNRGENKNPASDRRKEMAAIEPLIQRGDLKGIAAQLRLMKRHWENTNLGGLLQRRESEAELVENADRRYQEAEIVSIHPLQPLQP